MIQRVLIALAGLAALAAGAHAQDAEGTSPTRFEVQSDFGKQSAWVEPYLRKSARVLVELLDSPEVAPPATIRVTLSKAAAGLRGGASPVALAFWSDHMRQDRDRVWIIAHELSNLFAAHYAKGGGFPSDWWSNGRSPFPEYVSCLVMEKTGSTEAAKYRRGAMKDRQDHVLYWRLHEKHGFALFSRFFKLLRADGVDVGLIGAPWPSPDRRRSAYTMAYLSLAAGTNIAKLCREHGVGRKPTDWDRIHPEIPFPGYEVTATDVDRILAARSLLFGEKADRGYFEGLREAYRRGDVLNPEKGETGSSPIAFEVASEFGAESDWVASYLERLAVEIVGGIGSDDFAPPLRVKVTLRKDAALGAIAPVEQAGGFAFVSNVWPAEPFRFWLLGRGLTEHLVLHYGGKGLPSDWWGPGYAAFADPLAARALDAMDKAPDARFVRSRAGSERTHELFEKLLGDHGPELFGRFLGLLRADGLDLATLGRQGTVDPRRTEYAAAYLSLAARTNLAPLLREHGVGQEPPHWKAAQGTFPDYELTDKAVDRLMKRRDKLFTKPSSEKARDKFRKGK